MSRFTSNRRLENALLAASLGVWAASPALATTYVVSSGGTYSTIQSAINAASDGDEVLILDGSWSGAGNYDLDLMGKELTIRSSSGNAASCTIDCGFAGRGVRFDADDGDAVLQDLTIFNGVASEGAGVLIAMDATPTLRNVRIMGGYASYRGGGIRVWEGAVATIEDCNISNNWCTAEGGGLSIGSAVVTIIDSSIVNNEAELGGGAAIFQGTGGPPEVTFENCVIQGNEADDGAGLHALNSASLMISDSSIYQNDATSTGGALVLDGSEADLADCWLSGNGAGSQAGAVLAQNESAFRAKRTTFLGNSAPFSSAVRYEDSAGRLVSCQFLGNQGGSACGAFGSVLAIHNGLFSGNESTWVGGGVYADGATTLAMHSTTLSRNHSDASEGGGVYVASGGIAILHNTIAWQNDAGGAAQSLDQFGGAGTKVLHASCVQNLDMAHYGGGGNIDDDPMFVDSDGGNGSPGDSDDDCRLAAGSPAIDAGNDSSLPVDHLDLDDDSDATETLPLDLDGEARIQGVSVDMGAYEQLYVQGDLDGDGMVSTPDLVMLILGWGTDGPGADLAEPYDTVDVSDLTAMIVLWGM